MNAVKVFRNVMSNPEKVEKYGFARIFNYWKYKFQIEKPNRPGKRGFEPFTDKQYQWSNI